MRLCVSLLVCLSIAVLLYACIAVKGGSVLRPVAADRWRSPPWAQAAHPVVEYEDRNVQIRVAGPTWEVSNVVGLPLPGLPLGSDVPGPNQISISVRSKTDEPLKVDFTKLELLGGDDDPRRRYRHSVVPSDLTSPIYLARRTLSRDEPGSTRAYKGAMIIVSLQLEMPASEIRVCVLRFLDFINDGQNPIPELRFQADRFLGTEPLGP
jgi:hypothetical protein